MTISHSGLLFWATPYYQVCFLCSAVEGVYGNVT